MNYFLEKAIQEPELHARWLATLSFLELSGALKIASYLNKNLASEKDRKAESELLQHAAEEFRHASFFHKQIEKIKPASTQALKLCGRGSSRYLHLLDLRIARCLRKISYQNLNRGCYLLTTYAIEKRAQDVYGVYENLLRQNASSISIRSILLEENGHLRQIERDIESDPVLSARKDQARHFEQEIFSKFWEEISLTPDDELASLEPVNLTTLKMADDNDKISSFSS